MGPGITVGSTRSAHYAIAYHLVFVCKYRRRLLAGRVGQAACRIVREVARERGWTVVSANADRDHMHVFVSAPPTVPPSLIAQHLKGRSSYMLRRVFPHLRRREVLWTPAYYVGTAGAVSAATIRNYIENCQG